MLLGWWITRRLVNASEPLNAEQQDRVNDVLDTFGDQARVRVACSEAIEVPIIHGVIRPTILLPKSIFEGPEHDLRLHHCLAHEWQHLVRKDVRTWLLVGCFEPVLWCQPFYWQLRNILRVSQDQVADQSATSSVGDRAAYAETLLTYAELTPPRLTGALAMTNRPSTLYQRINLLMDDQFSFAPNIRKRVFLLLATIIATFCFLFTSVNITAAPAAQREIATDSLSPKTAGVLVTVQDENGQPIADAKVTVLKWDGKYSRLASSTLDDSGTSEISDIELGSYPQVLVQHEAFATSMLPLSLTADETNSVVVELASPVRGWLEMKSPDGTPLAGVEVQHLRFTDANGVPVFLDREIAASLGYDWQRSDPQGRLLLPALPIGAAVKVSVIHPDWRPKLLAKLVAAATELADVTFETGPKVTIKFRPILTAADELEGKQVEIHMSTFQGDRSTDLVHRFTIENGQIKFTAHPVHYQDLHIIINDYFAPTFSIFPLPEPRLNLRENDAVEFTATLKRKTKARGRVVDSDGNPVAEAWVFGIIAEPENSETQDVPFGLKPGEMAGGEAVTDADGNYEIEMSTGLASVSAVVDRHYAEPTRMQISSSQPEHNQFPDIVMRRISQPQGQVLGIEGKPVPNAVVRMLSLGHGNGTPVGVTDENGNFKLKLKEIPRSTLGGGLETEAYFVAFDPKGNWANRVSADLLNEEAVENITIQLEKKPADWIRKPLEDIEDSDQVALGKMQQESGLVEMFMQQQELTAKKYAAGLPGNLSPSINVGTWLNTEATSLADFRGKYVLLDFWFVGCGPCVSELPKLKLAQQVYAESNFTVIGVHTNSQTADEVRAFMKKRGINYPVVVDNAAGEITEAYRKIGLTGFPRKFLIGPDGKIIVNGSATTDETRLDLHSNTLESIHFLLHGGKN